MLLLTQKDFARFSEKVTEVTGKISQAESPNNFSSTICHLEEVECPLCPSSLVLPWLTVRHLRPAALSSYAELGNLSCGLKALVCLRLQAQTWKREQRCTRARSDHLFPKPERSSQSWVRTKKNCRLWFVPLKLASSRLGTGVWTSGLRKWRFTRLRRRRSHVTKTAGLWCVNQLWGDQSSAWCCLCVCRKHANASNRCDRWSRFRRRFGNGARLWHQNCL